MHPHFTFVSRDDLAVILCDDGVWFEASVSSQTESSICRLDCLNTNVVRVSRLGAFGLDAIFEVCEWAILAFCPADIAVGVITFIHHMSIHTILVAARVRIAATIRVLYMLDFFPHGRSIIAENV